MKPPRLRPRLALFVSVSVLLFLWPPGVASAAVFVRGQVNDDAVIDLSDPIALFGHLFLGDPPPSCLNAADSNDDARVDISDGVYLLQFLFLGGPPPPAPYPAPGPDPTPDGQPCAERPLTDFRVAPSNLDLPRPGEVRQLEVTGLIGGVPARLEEAEAGTAYASSAPAVAIAYRDGLVEALGPGTATITVQHGTAAAEVTVRVSGAFVERHRVLAANDLGMHCIDREFSVYSILPPFNVVNAQVLARGEGGAMPRLLGDTEVLVTYSAAPDRTGSINSTSQGKSSFWTHAQELYGMVLEPLQGLLGAYLPGDAPRAGPQPLAVVGAGMFSAAGIPIIDLDDRGEMNPFPVLRIAARDIHTGAVLAATEVVVPVSSETDCQNCHATGARAASDPSIAWSDHPDREVQTKRNVLLLHDRNQGTDLGAEQPVLCARCHYSRALDLSGSGPQGEQVGRVVFTEAMHRYHGKLEGDGGQPLFPPEGDALDTCYQCHPGRVTQCQRGAMKNGGLQCRECHGSMLSVGGEHPLLAGGSIDGENDGRPRRGWTDLPRCQSCHTGDAVDRLAGTGLVPAPDGIRLRQAFRQNDPSASPLLATNTRFAENARTLYRFSRGHGGLACQACHGSTHAEFPHADPAANDNLAALHLQGHTGPIGECGTCHSATLAMTTRGPHGLHNLGDARWTDHEHEEFFERDSQGCQACHGLGLEGTALSRATADRSFRVEDRTVTIPKGTPVGCTHCHGKPGET